jgi:hypothetical protein
LVAGAREGAGIARQDVGEKVAKGAFPVLRAMLATEGAQRFDEMRTTIGVGVTVSGCIE